MLEALEYQQFCLTEAQAQLVLKDFDRLETFLGGKIIPMADESYLVLAYSLDRDAGDPEFLPLGLRRVEIPSALQPFYGVAAYSDEDEDGGGLAESEELEV